MNYLYINDNLITLKSLDDNSIDCIYTDPPYLTGNSKLTYKDNKKESEWIEFMRERLVECKRVMKKSATMLIHIDENMHIELAALCYEVFGKKNHITTLIWKKRTSGSSQSKFATVEHEYIIAVAKNIKKCKWNGIPQFEIEGTTYPKRDDVDDYTEKQQFDLTNGMKGSKYPIYHDSMHKLNDVQPSSGLQNGKNGYPIYVEENGDKLYPHQERGNGKGPNQHYPLYHDGTQLAQRLDKTSKTERNPETRPNAVYPIHHNKIKISLTPFPGSIEVLPMNGKELGCWRCIPSTCQKLIDADMLVVKNGKIYQKQYANYQFNKKTGKLEPFVRTMPIKTILQGDKYPTNLRSNKEIKEIFGKSAFTYAKPLELVKNLLKIVSNEGDVILDIFAGSGTTGQAAYELKREFILCQLDEGGIPELIKIRLDKTVGKNNYEINE